MSAIFTSATPKWPDAPDVGRLSCGPGARCRPDLRSFPLFTPPTFGFLPSPCTRSTSPLSGGAVAGLPANVERIALQPGVDLVPYFNGNVWFVVTTDDDRLRRRCLALPAV